MSRQIILRAYRYALDPTPAQSGDLNRHAGAARWAYNHALAVKVAAHEEWRRRVAGLVEAGTPEVEARKQVKVPVPAKPAIQKALNQVKGDSRTGVDGVCPWWHEVNTYAFQSAFLDADTAWKNWMDSLKGRRKGRPVGYPRFKKRGAVASFRLHHDVKRPSIRLAGYRRLRLPRIGEVRIHGSGKDLARAVARGDAVVQSVTVSRRGHRWYASVLCKVTVEIPDGPTRAQRARGAVGVDAGVKVLAALSKPLDAADPGTVIVPNGRPLAVASRRLVKAQRALARKQKGSNRRVKAVRRVARLHHEVSLRRGTAIHTLTKRLAAGFDTVAVEDLNVAGMVRSAKGTVEQPGRNVRAKAGLNRSVLDAALGEMRRQLEYKTGWYGSRLAVVDRWFPSSKTCSVCGAVKESLALSERVYVCSVCGARLDRDVNAARNIEAAGI